jgi:hypothetical protein
MPSLAALWGPVVGGGVLVIAVLASLRYRDALLSAWALIWTFRARTRRPRIDQAALVRGEVRLEDPRRER